MSRTRIKICGIRNVDDALFAARAGADAIGLIFHPESPRFVGIEQALVIRKALPSFVSTVALVHDADRETVARIIDTLRPSLLQFHGAETPEFCASFAWPYLRAIGVDTAMTAADLVKLQSQYQTAAALLLDTRHGGKSGGTGQVFDWSVIPGAMKPDIVLAGGLNPDNVGHAVKTVRPWAVDVSSGVEAEKGRKDHAKVAAFINQVRVADADV